MSALMLGLAGPELRDDERLALVEPSVAGVILFTRNFVDAAQVAELCATIRACAPQAVIAVDQEGGRVQRFRPGFTPLPPLARIGALHARQPAAALERV